MSGTVVETLHQHSCYPHFSHRCRTIPAASKDLKLGKCTHAVTYLSLCSDAHAILCAYRMKPHLMTCVRCLWALVVSARCSPGQSKFILKSKSWVCFFFIRQVGLMLFKPFTLIGNHESIRSYLMSSVSSSDFISFLLDLLFININNL